MPHAQSQAVRDTTPLRIDRKSALAQARSSLQGLSTLAAFTPAPGLSICISLVITIIDSVNGASSNQDACLQLAVKVADMAQAIFHQTAEQEDANTNELTHSIGQLTVTLEAIKAFICKQQGRKYISRMLTYAGDGYNLRKLNNRLDNDLALFGFKSHMTIQYMLAKIFWLITGGTDRNVSLDPRTSPASKAVGSLVLPPLPSIFYGRQAMVDNIVETIVIQEPARVAILGAGGIGKTSLSLVVLHHPKVVDSFKSSRWFIQCQGSTTPQGLVSTIANRLELSGDKLFEQIILFFEAQRTILVLDNFETPWETVATRVEIEKKLSRLAAIPTLTLLITMRGSERPVGTAWTRPFIAPLAPLDFNAARRTFVTISDTPKDDPHIAELLTALDNVPLAITLMANLAQSETPKVLLRRWYLENTNMLTRGPDHDSSLDISISVSLDGPRMRENPDANRLLRLLALLPQGSKDLEEIAPHIQNVHRSATVLKQVGLAYTDGVGSLCVLAPVRRFVIHNYPPDPASWWPVQTHYENLAELSSKIERGTEGKAIIERLSSQTSNMQAVFEYSLDMNGADYRKVIRASIDLTGLFKYTGLGSLTSLEKSAKKAESIGDKALLADCIRSQAEVYYSRSSRELATTCFQRALNLYKELGDEHLSEQGRCTMMLGMLEGQSGNRYQEAIVKIEHAIELHRRVRDVIGEADCLMRLAQNAIAQEKYSIALSCVNTAIRVYENHTYLRGQARCKWLLGVISQERRINHFEASEMVVDATWAYRHLGDFTGNANCLRILGRIALQTAKYGDAIQHLQSAMTLYRKVKRVYGEADCYQAIGEVHMGRRDEASAEPLFKQAQALFSEINHRKGKVFCTRALGDIAFRRREYAFARQIYEQALALSTSEVDKCRAEFGIANVALALDEDEKARVLYDKVLPVFQQHGNAVPDEAHTLKKLGDVAVKSGNDKVAKDQFEEALVKFRLTGLVPAQADCLKRLAEVAKRQFAWNEVISRYEEAMDLYGEAEDEEGREFCSLALQKLKNATSVTVTPRAPQSWLRLL